MDLVTVEYKNAVATLDSNYPPPGSENYFADLRA